MDSAALPPAPFGVNRLERVDVGEAHGGVAGVRWGDGGREGGLDAGGEGAREQAVEMDGEAMRDAGIDEGCEGAREHAVEVTTDAA